MQQMVPITKALEVLGIAIPNTSRTSFEIPCPICDRGLSNRGKTVFRLNVNIGKNAFRCPKCGESGGPAGLYAFIRYGMTKKDMTPEKKSTMIKEILGLKPGEKINTANYDFKQYEIKKVDVPPASIEVRDNTYNCLLDKLPLLDEHYNNLVKRGLREQDIIANGYKSTPKIGINKIPNDLRRVNACSLLGVPGFFKRDEQWVLTKVNKGIMIPVRQVTTTSKKGLIEGLQIRFDVVNEDDPRYKWLSTRDMESGCAAETWSHFVGYPEQKVILTEGPLKADIINRFLDKPVVAVPGVHALQHLETILITLQRLGVRTIQTAFDMDYMKNANVQDAYVKLVELISKYGFSYERLVWDENYKGLDDYLLHIYLEKGGKLDPLK